MTFLTFWNQHPFFQNSRPELLVKAPGRINLIGEHTDYHEGWVLPAAIEQGIWLAFKRSDLKGRCRVYSSWKNETKVLSFNKMGGEKGWWNYLENILDYCKRQGILLAPVDILLDGDLPVGAGLSSSSALTCGFLAGLNQLFNWQFPTEKLIEMASIAEYQIGVEGGKMDQTAIMYGVKGKFLLLDNQTASFSFIDGLPGEYGLLLFDSGVSHTLADSSYNLRRKESEAVLPFLKKENIVVKSLRDVKPDLLESYKTILPAIPFQRAGFVLKENQRVLDCVSALKKGDMNRVGALLNASHAGLQTEYEVSCKELDTLCEIACKTDGVLGARMMGGGFGGCTINLIEKKFENQIIKNISDGFKRATGKNTKAIVVQPSSGLTLEMLNHNQNIA